MSRQKLVRQKLVIFLLAFWVLSVGYGIHVLMAYKGKAGFAGTAPERWVQNDLIALSTERPQLIMFVHPRCPCTRASLEELAVLLTRAQGRFEAAVLFYVPEADAAAWSQTATLNFARRLPGLRVLPDPEGRLARRFGAETSGHTMIYGSDGLLRFSGGITGARGHVGDNAGFDSALKVLYDQTIARSPTTPSVFGCELFDP